jgi:hypothetical protein
MMRLLIGLCLVILGVASFVMGLQYASLLTAGGLNAPTQERFDFLSSMFGYGSYVLVLAGIGVTLWAIRRLNKRGRESGGAPLGPDR